METTRLFGERYSSNGISLEADDSVPLKVIETRRDAGGGDDDFEGGSKELPVRSVDIKASSKILITLTLCMNYILFYL